MKFNNSLFSNEIFNWVISENLILKIDKDPLILAAELGYNDIMQILLSHGKVDINHKSI